MLLCAGVVGANPVLLLFRGEEGALRDGTLPGTHQVPRSPPYMRVRRAVKNDGGS
jgi:hypothetical protein